MANIYEKLGPSLSAPERTTLVDVFDLDIQASIAATGSVISQAAALTGDIAVVVTATSATADCVQIRDNSFNKGRLKVQYVVNRSASQVRVFCPTGGKMNNTSNGSVTLSSGTHGAFITIDQSTNDIIKL